MILKKTQPSKWYHRRWIRCWGRHILARCGENNRENISRMVAPHHWAHCLYDELLGGSVDPRSDPNHSAGTAPF